MNFLLYFGLLNCVFIPLAVYFLWSKNNYFNFFELPLTYSGTTHTKKPFIVLTCIGITIELLFVMYLLNAFNLTTNNILMYFAAIGFLGIFITALTPQGRPRLHRAGIRIMITVMVFWSMYLHFLLFSVSSKIALLGTALSTICLFGVSYFYFFIKSKGYTELFFIGIVLLWNILMTYLLITN